MSPCWQLIAPWPSSSAWHEQGKLTGVDARPPGCQGKRHKWYACEIPVVFLDGWPTKLAGQAGSSRLFTDGPRLPLTNSRPCLSQVARIAARASKPRSRENRDPSSPNRSYFVINPWGTSLSPESRSRDQHSNSRARITCSGVRSGVWRRSSSTRGLALVGIALIDASIRLQLTVATPTIPIATASSNTTPPAGETTCSIAT